MNLKELKKIKDSQGYPENLDELQDWGVDAESIVEFFDQWANTEMKRDFMDSLAEVFEGPESLDDDVCDYFMNTFGNEHDYREVVAELDQFLSTDKLKEFIEDFDRAYDFSYYLTGYKGITDDSDSGKSMLDIIETVVYPAIDKFKENEPADMSIRDHYKEIDRIYHEAGVPTTSEEQDAWRYLKSKVVENYSRSKSSKIPYDEVIEILKSSGNPYVAEFAEDILLYRIGMGHGKLNDDGTVNMNYVWRDPSLRKGF